MTTRTRNSATASCGQLGSLLRNVGLVSLALCALASISQAATTNVVLRLDAAMFGSAVTGLSRWEDTSGNDHDATQSTSGYRPNVVMGVKNGLPVVRFDGSDDRMSIAHEYTCGSVFVVADYNTATFGSYDGLYAGTANLDSHLYFTGNGGQSYWYGTTELNQRYDNGSGPQSTIATLNQWNLYSGIDSTPQALSGYTIATDRSNGGRFWDGDIAEVIVYDDDLSDIDRKGVEVYLDEKWGLGLGLRASYGSGNFNDDTVALGLTTEANIVLRLDASQYKSAVTDLAIWGDSSVYGHDAAGASDPEVVLAGKNGLPVVRLDGNDSFSIPDEFTAGTVFAVAEYDSASFTGHDGLLTGDGSSGTEIYFGGENTKSQWWGETSLSSRYENGNGPKSTITTLNQWNLFSGIDVTPQSLTGWCVGIDRGYAGRQWSGDIAEIIVYDEALSPSDRKGVEVYLDEKWKLGKNLRSSYGAGNFNDDPASLGLTTTTTMAVRLDASEFTSAGVISAWPDTSGNGRDAAAVNDPTVVLNQQNSLPVVRIDVDAFTIPGSYTTGSAFIIAKYNSTTFNWYDGLYGSATDNTGTGMYFSGVDGASTWDQSTGSGFKGAQYLNGTETTTALTDPSAFNIYSGIDTTPNSFTSWNLAKDRAIGGRTWEGDIAEVIVFEEALSAYDRKGVEVYLDEKWGLGNDLRTSYGAGNFNDNPYELGLSDEPTMIVRLDASILGATTGLATWTDRSGNGHAATQGTAANQPSVVAGVQNGLSVVRYDSSDFMTVDHTYVTASAFIIAKYANAVFSGHDGLYGAATGAGSVEQYWSGGDGGTTWGNESGGGFYSSKYRNGVLTGAALTDPAAFNLYSGVDATPNAFTSWTVGGDRAFGASRSWEGDIAEVIVYEEALTDFDRKGVEVYLDEKWGLGLGLRASYGASNFNDDSEALGFPSGGTLFRFR